MVLYCFSSLFHVSVLENLFTCLSVSVKTVFLLYSFLNKIICCERIAGWNYRVLPHLGSEFHIGDQVIAINNTAVISTKCANNILKLCDGKTDAVVTVKRLPHAVVILVKEEGKCFADLGIKNNNGTAEVSC